MRNPVVVAVAALALAACSFEPAAAQTPDTIFVGDHIVTSRRRGIPSIRDDGGRRGRDLGADLPRRIPHRRRPAAGLHHREPDHPQRTGARAALARHGSRGAARGHPGGRLPVLRGGHQGLDHGGEAGRPRGARPEPVDRGPGGSGAHRGARDVLARALGVRAAAGSCPVSAGAATHPVGHAGVDEVTGSASAIS